jgi:hypothetical protein
MSASSAHTRRAAGWRGELGGGGSTTRAWIACSPLIIASLLFAAPVFLGVVISVVRLLGIRYPDLGVGTTVNSDAEELYLGHTLYQNPAHGYTGELYTPLFAGIVSLFDRVYLWNGWPLLVVFASSLSLAALAARIAYTRTTPLPRLVCALGALGVGGTAYWCVSSVSLPELTEARCDQLAWAFALYGLVAVADFGRRPSSRRVVVAVLLLSAALWTKQTTVAIVVPSVVWVMALASLSLLARRAAVLFAGLLCALNLAVLGLLNIVTHGWEFYINFELATRQAVEKSYGTCLTLALQSVAVAFVFAFVTWLASVVYGAVRARSQRRPHTPAVLTALRGAMLSNDPTGRRILLLAAYIPVGFVLSVYFMRKQGTYTNQMIGVAWALGLLAAAGWRVAQRRPGTAAITGACVAALFALTRVGAVDAWATRAEVGIPSLERVVPWDAIPKEVIAYARRHTLYGPLYSDLNVPQGGPLYPNYFNFADLLAAGVQPMYVVDALLDRRFDGVEYFVLDGDAYASAYGKWEENYLWKLDEVIQARYAPMPGLPQGVLGRRPGPEQASWMRYCFAPFRAGGASFRIHHGGGFWCSFAPGRLQLVDAPVPLSEVVTTGPVHARGSIALRFKDPAAEHAELVLEAGSGARWVVRVTGAHGSSRELAVSAQLGDSTLGSGLVRARKLPGGWLGVRLRLTPDRRPGAPQVTGAGAVTLTAPVAQAPFAVIAADGVAVDLRGMSFGG